MRVVPLSCCRTICVLRAMRAEKSVGSASASSSALVCSDWVWPCVAAIASIMVRETLLNTSCAASDQPEVCECVRSESERAILRLERLHQLRPEHARGAQLGDLHEDSSCRSPRRTRARGANWSTVSPAFMPARTYSTPSASV